MLRTFAEHELRESESLDGRWAFAIDPDGGEQPPEEWGDTIQVPSCWELRPGLETYRGVAWYRTEIELEEACHVRLVFGGVAHHAQVWVDGEVIGDHYDAYTPFALIATRLAEGAHEVVVRVDNRFGPASALHIENDYYSWGGITRPAMVEFIGDTFIERLHATPSRVRGEWQLAVSVQVRNLSAEAVERDVVIALEGMVLDCGTISLPAGGVVEATGTLKRLPVEAWSADNPALYQVGAFLRADGSVIDDMIDRVGFRTVAVRGKKLLLNGEPLALRGFNRHESHACFGSSLPLQAMAQDLELIRSSGANFVRTCHYPNDQRFLDLCDELGLYVWEESHARDIPFDQPAYAEQMATNTAEMVAWHYNHPAIVIWGCLNECDSISDAGVAEHARILQILRDHDGSRPVSFASNKQVDDRALHLVDIVSWNLYPGWYGGGPETVAPKLTEMLSWLRARDNRSGAKGKPVIMSEFGGGAFYGCRQTEAAKWSEEYQAQLLDESLRVYLGSADVVGVAIWQYADCRVTAGWGVQRPRTHNNKGMLDEYRRPKLAWHAVTKHFQAAAMAELQTRAAADR